MYHLVKETLKYKYVIYNFVNTGLKTKYRKSFLGFFWTVLSPLIYYTSLGMAFIYKFNVDSKSFLVHLFVGSIAYNFMTSILSTSPHIFLQNENYIKKIYVPKTVFILNLVFFEAVNSIFIFCAVFLLGLVTGSLTFSYHFIFIFYAIFVTMLFCSGLSCILACLGVYFRDLGHIVPVFLQSFYFLTPIIWYVNEAPGFMQIFTKFNIFYYYIEVFRIPFLSNTFPPLSFCLITFFAAFLSFLIGLWTLDKLKDKVIFKL
jgi:ABC-type polysaccharide/polyol phosphate export permease